MRKMSSNSSGLAPSFSMAMRRTSNLSIASELSVMNSRISFSTELPFSIRSLRRSRFGFRFGGLAAFRGRRSLLGGHADGLSPVGGLDNIGQADALQNHLLDLAHRSGVVYQQDLHGQVLISGCLLMGTDGGIERLGGNDPPGALPVPAIGF